MDPFRGVCPIVATPFTASGDVDESSLADQVAALEEGGCHGAILFGFAGEFYKLTEEEQGRIVQRCVAAASDDFPLSVSITAQATTVAVDRARAAESVGADGLMLLPPFVMSPGEDALREHVSAVADAVSLPVMVQYAPDNTGVAIAPDTLAELAESHDNVRHFKVECAPPGPYVTSLLDAAPDDVSVLVGSGGRHYPEILDRGGVGVVPGGSLHELYVEIQERYDAGDREAAIDIWRDLLGLLTHMGQTGEMFVHYEKRMLADRGFIDADHPRRPSFEPDQYQDELFWDLYEPLRDRAESLRVS